MLRSRYTFQHSGRPLKNERFVRPKDLVLYPPIGVWLHPRSMWDNSRGGRHFCRRSSGCRATGANQNNPIYPGSSWLQSHAHLHTGQRLVVPRPFLPRSRHKRRGCGGYRQRSFFAGHPLCSGLIPCHLLLPGFSVPLRFQPGFLP